MCRTPMIYSALLENAIATLANSMAVERKTRQVKPYLCLLIAQPHPYFFLFPGNLVEHHHYPCQVRGCIREATAATGEDRSLIR